MHVRFLFFISLFVGAMFSACARHGIAEPVAAPLAPRRDWRVVPLEAHAAANAEGLVGLFRREWSEVSFPPGTQPWIAVELPRDRTNPLMLTYCQPDRSLKTRAAIEVSADSTNGSDGTWRTVGQPYIRWFLEKADLAPDAPENWLRVRLEPRGESWPTTATLTMTDVGLFEIDPAGRNDYWVIIGASIQQQSISNSVFSQMVRERHPGYDPVIFNLGVGGWRTNQLVERLPGYLDDHLHAAYIGIHIGGNNVSAFRPYPGGGEELEAHLVQILEMIRDAGKEPILSRLSYRAYHERGEKGPVPPEENGSGPYVAAIYDPLIARYCPDFFDPETGKGVVNAYDYFRTHPEELADDGIHMRPAGEFAWNRLWAESAGNVIYGVK